MEVPENYRVLISACLVGCKCRYDGNHQLREKMVELQQRANSIIVCPEELGGLPTPRHPAEIKGDAVISKCDEDLTEKYRSGAQRALDLAIKKPIDLAFLKSKSPMCGSGKIYDGSFSGKLIDGDGIFAKLLKNRGVQIIAVD